MRNINGILQLTSLAITVPVLALFVYCLGNGRDMLAIYWGAAAVFALRFGMTLSESE